MPLSLAFFLLSSSLISSQLISLFALQQLETRLTASSERLEVMQKEADKVTQMAKSVRTKEHEMSMLKQELEVSGRLPTPAKASAV